MNSRKGYTSIGVPNVLIDELDKIRKKSGLGYRSRSEFIIALLREEVKKNKKIKG